MLRLRLGETQIVQITGKTARAALKGCGGVDIPIANQSDPEPRPRLRFDAQRLRDANALAIWDVPGNLRAETVAERAGRRPLARSQ